MSSYQDINRANWDERAAAHAASPDYQVARFTEDAEHLSQTVCFDRPRLGDIASIEGVHLQCHIGTDTASLARLGARMTGLDFSPPALHEARALARVTGLAIDYVLAELYDAPTALGVERFDLVYTGIGALCWLPDIRRWAGVVATLLRPGGRLFLREGHPVMWALGEPRPDGLLVLELPYFEQPQPNVFTTPGSYVATDRAFTHNTTHEWNHGIGEIITALVEAGMQITAFEEHDSIPWNAWPGRMTALPGGEFRLTERPDRLPLSYTLQARRAR